MTMRHVLMWAAVAVVAAGLAGCNGQETAGVSGSTAHLLHISSMSEFEQQVLRSDQPVLVDFYASWCGPCKALAPTIESLAGEYAGKARVVKIDADANRELGQVGRVDAYPTVVLYNKGKEVQRWVGARGASTYRAALDAQIK